MGVTRGKSAKQKTRAILQQERAAKAMELGLRGFSHGQIAKELGVNRATVDADYRRTLALALERRRELGELQLEETLNRLEAKIAKLDAMIDSAAEYDDRQWSQWLRYETERARLLDLYPKQTTQVNDNRQQVFVLQWDGGRTTADNGDNTIEGNARPLLPGDPEEDDSGE